MNFNFTIPTANKLFIFIKIQPIINFYSSDKINQVELGEKKQKNFSLSWNFLAKAKQKKYNKKRTKKATSRSFPLLLALYLLKEIYQSYSQLSFASKANNNNFSLPWKALLLNNKSNYNDKVCWLEATWMDKLLLV